jgi:hypothetical protein
MSYKALFAIAASLDLEIEQMDVKTAFLYGTLDEKFSWNNQKDLKMALAESVVLTKLFTA